MANHESYFCEKGEKCHQKGSVDNPIGLKITTLLADQSGNRQRTRDVMQSATGLLGDEEIGLIWEHESSSISQIPGQVSG